MSGGMQATALYAAARLQVFRTWRAVLGVLPRRLSQILGSCAPLLFVPLAILFGLYLGLSVFFAGSVEVDVVFVTDCSDYQEWLTQVFLSRWRRVGPPGAGASLTRILACDNNDTRLDRVLGFSTLMATEELLGSTPEIFQLPELNGKGTDRYLCNNRPRGIARWLLARPPRSQNHWIALLDPDMLVLRPLDPLGLWRLEGGAAGSEPTQWYLADVPAGVALAHHFPFVPVLWKQVNLSLSQLCEDARGQQRDLTDCEARLQDMFSDPDLVAAEYAVGVPHVIRAVDLARMCQVWGVFTDAVRLQYRGWTAEMVSWILTARYAGVRFAYFAEVVSDPAAPEPAWARVDQGGGDDACLGEGAGAEVTATGEVVEGQSQQLPAGPWLVHFCEIYNVSYASDHGKKEVHLDKRQVAKTLQAANISSLLDCEAPLFEVPPSDLLHRPWPQSRGGPAPQLFRRGAWMMCTTLHALNTGLRDFRRRRCPDSPSSWGLESQSRETLRALPKAAQVSEQLGQIFGLKSRSSRGTQAETDWASRLEAVRQRQQRRQQLGVSSNSTASERPSVSSNSYSSNPTSSPGSSGSSSQSSQSSSELFLRSDGRMPLLRRPAKAAASSTMGKSL